ncbi:hypothetical protein GCM10017586_27880 [Microbacterium imperiale]|uniref:Uncharacterized protein n=1 Tax=Microbacterium imperiale TaxID=33884 RepID=A0A9W6M4F6_9MICO|nr:hypothetical protein GCM10017544_00700 [Microbacterium imperiale]GLJ81105.1 hypothetical protein GCM10017586_27880 [Microbacterium imperiale]
MRGGEPALPLVAEPGEDAVSRGSLALALRERAGGGHEGRESHGIRLDAAGADRLGITEFRVECRGCGDIGPAGTQVRVCSAA